MIMMKIKKNMSWNNTIIFVLLISIIIKITGGVRSLPGWLQVISIALIPVVLTILIFKNKNEFNKNQLNYLRVFLFLLTIVALIFGIGTICRYYIVDFWNKNAIYFKVSAVTIFILDCIYMTIASIKYAEKE